MATNRAGRLACTLTLEGDVRLWDIGGELQLVRAQRLERACSVVFLEQRDAIAIALPDGVEIVSIADGRRIAGIPIGEGAGELEALALSPDGRWAAVAGFREQVRLLGVDDWRERDRVEGGEAVLGLAFDAASGRLATACSFQNGAMVRIDRVLDGALRPLHEVWRSNYQTPSSAFVDRISSVAWSLDGARLALFETAAVGGLHDEPGWRGNIAVVDPDSGAVVWERSLGRTVGGDPRTLHASGYLSGFPAQLAFDAAGDVVCGTTGGTIAVSDGRNGERRRTLAVDGGVEALGVIIGAGGRVWAVSPDGALHPAH